jgi:hypothetical protein
MMLIASLPNDAANAAMRDGSMKDAIARSVQRLKPEACYFGVGDDGTRTVYMVFDLADASQMVPAGEPFFLNMNARLTMRPVMNADDLAKGFGALEAALAH